MTYGSNTRHVCAYLNAFSTEVQNIVIKFKDFDIDRFFILPVLLQLEFGDYKSGSDSNGSLNALSLNTNIDAVLDRFYPKRYKVTEETELK